MVAWYNLRIFENEDQLHLFTYKQMMNSPARKELKFLQPHAAFQRIVRWIRKGLHVRVADINYDMFKVWVAAGDSRILWIFVGVWTKLLCRLFPFTHMIRPEPRIYKYRAWHVQGVRVLLRHMLHPAMSNV